MISDRSQRRWLAPILFGLLCSSSAHADDLAPPAKIAPEAGLTLPAGLLTIPDLDRPQPRRGLELPARSAPPATEPSPTTYITVDADRSRPKVPAVTDGDRDLALLLRLRVPF